MTNQFGCLMRDMVNAMPLKPGDTVSKEAVRNWFAANYPKIKDSTIAAHLIRLSTNARGRVHHNIKPVEDDLFFQVDGSHFRLFNPQTDPPPIQKGADGTGPPVPSSKPDSSPDGVASDDATEFAYEADLRNLLAKKLQIIEPGLHLYEEEGVTGIEFPAGGRFIDILAVDARGGYVVIELKVSRGYDRVVGQLRRYMGWVAKHHAEPGQAVRGVIVAREISEDLGLRPPEKVLNYSLRRLGCGRSATFCSLSAQSFVHLAVLERMSVSAAVFGA
jgi:hypothetical protein